MAAATFSHIVDLLCGRILNGIHWGSVLDEGK
jgi:hypothetical protein